MTEHCLLIGVVGFTTSGISGLKTEFLLSLKLTARTENCQRKIVSWKLMFYNPMSISACIHTALLYGSTLTCMSFHMVKKTTKNCAYTYTLCPVFLKYKVNLTINMRLSIFPW